ncbi:MAG TPA: hydroxymethylbilane synthase [Burkholderiales bacterium]
MKKLVIATRRSRLALWQAEHVGQRLAAAHRGLAVELLPMTTRGDELLDARLDQAGGKGLFIKELEQALADGKADIAVHSMKDLPADLPPGFTVAAILEREDPRDAFVSNTFNEIKNLPQRAVVGTSSLRRAAQILERYPSLEAKLLRGNVETRLAKLDRGEYDAVILAVAGLLRLGLRNRIRARLDPEDSLPAPGQGALGVECLDSRADLKQLLQFMDHAPTAACIRAERAVSRALGGSCTLPLGAYAQVDGVKLHLRALVASPDGRRVARANGTGDDPERLGAEVAGRLRALGAEDILRALA